MGRVCKYYSNWQQEAFTCAHCGWTGNVGYGDLEAGDVTAIIECPKCYRSLGVIMYPNLEDTKEAAAQGNEKAIQELPEFEARIERNQELLKRFDREKLQNPDELPELDGESLEFLWDFLKGDDGEFYQSIRLGNVEVWKELAFFNNVRRFEQMKELFKLRYGSRFKSLTPTDDSIEWLTGDKFGVALRLVYT
jgi:hypothetical protein